MDQALDPAKSAADDGPVEPPRLENTVNRFFLVLLLVISCFSCAPSAPTPEYLAEIDQWRSAREARLQQEYGWLSVVGLHWIEEGRQRLGSDPSAEIRLPEGHGPPIAGTLELLEGVLTLRPAEGAEFLIDGEPVGERVLMTDATGAPDQVFLGALRLVPLSRVDRLALRVRDPAAPARSEFTGLEYYDVDWDWRIEARWQAFETPREVQIPNVLGSTYPGLVPGAAVFEFGGETVTLLPTVEDPSDPEQTLFFVFGDGTNGTTTYGGGRFLSASPPKDGVVVLDFNRAYSPPCAFTAHATCPLPMAENRLRIRIEAGEKVLAGGHSH